MAAGHFIADGNLPLLRNVAAHNLIDAGAQLIAVGAGKFLHIHNDAVFAMGHAQRSIAHLARLLAKDGAQQTLLSGELRLALRRHFTNKDIARVHLSAYTNHTEFIEILQCILADVRNIAGDLLRPKLRIARFRFILLNMNRSEHIVAHNLFIDQDGVLVVVAFPGHKANQHIFAEADLTVGGGGTVRDHLVRLHMLAAGNNRPLVDAGALVRTHEFNHVIGVDIQIILLIVGFNLNLFRADVRYRTGTFCEHCNARVNGGLIFHASADDRRFRFEQRYSLPLHVGAHQCTVCVVVFQEGDHRRGDGYNHLRRNIHEIRLGVFNFQKFIAVTCIDLRAGKTAIFIERLIGLGHDVIILHIGRHINHFIQHHARLFINTAERRFNEAIFIDPRKSGKVGDQADVRAFRRFNWAHAAIVAIVYVTHLKSGTVSGKAAGAKGGKAALMRQLRQRIRLIHKLRQRRGAEKLLDGSQHGANINQRLGRNRCAILRLKSRHAFAHHALHAGKANAELVLQQFAHRTNAAVAQMVDIIRCSDLVRQAIKVVDGRKNIINRDMLRNQVVTAAFQLCKKSVTVVAALFEDFHQNSKANLFIDADILKLLLRKINISADIHHAIGDHFDLFAFHIQISHAYAGLFNLIGLFAREHLSCLSQQFTGHWARNGLHELVAG